MVKGTYLKSIIIHLLRLIRYNEGCGYTRLRTNLTKMLFLKSGENIKISTGVFIDYPENIQVGNNVSIQKNCDVSGFGHITIGSDVSIGPNTSIFSSHHPYELSIIRKNALEARPVSIGNNVWIGARCVILGGVTIGNNIVIGAGAVVTKSLEDNGVYAGNPAKLIKQLTGR